MPRITETFEIFTPESVENGDAEERGFIDEEGEEIELDEYDKEEGLTIVDKAVEFLKDKGVEESSASFFHLGFWYTTYKYREDFSTGEEENRSYHLEGFTEQQEREIYERMKM